MTNESTSFERLTEVSICGMNIFCKYGKIFAMSEKVKSDEGKVEKFYMTLAHRIKCC
jgi:hypothetical protein